MKDRNNIYRLDLSRLTVLVVDDNLYMRRIIKTMLSGFGIHTIFEASDGAEGFEVYERMAPDLIVTDWDMPYMDGVEMTRRIRWAMDSRDPDIPIVMMSSRTEKHRVLEARDAGITEFLAKPTSAKSLYLRLASALTSPRPFVRSKHYVGPDRRRFVHPNYEGFERRGAEEGAEGKEPAEPPAIAEETTQMKRAEA